MTEQEQITKLLADADEAADFLEAFVVQAKLNERGNFGEQAHAIHSIPVMLLCDASRSTDVNLEFAHLCSHACGATPCRRIRRGGSIAT